MSSGDSLHVLATSVALIVTPLLAGALLGAAIRRFRGRRLDGLLAAIGCLVVPAAAISWLGVHLPIVGIWDSMLEGIFAGMGVAWQAHRAYAERFDVALAVGALGAALFLLELGCLLFLPTAPAFPTRGGPHLRFSEAIRAADVTHGWDLLSKEYVCSAIYGGQYSGILDISEHSDVLLPQWYGPPPAGATRRVLHIGDSMVFGFGVGRDETFEAELSRIEPGSEHVNGGIPGIAPDAYLSLLRRWLNRGPFENAIMYLYEGNDVRDLDSPFPCCRWRSLLTYDAGLASPRCPTASAPALARAGWTWLRYNSPPPYLLRALIGFSAGAAHLSALLMQAGQQRSLHVDQPKEIRLEHLEAILRAARDEVPARGGRFVVVTLPASVVGRDTPGLAQEMADIGRRLGIPTFDATPPLTAATAHGERLFFENDPHFNPAGHRFMARWLHDHLAEVPPATP